MIELQTRESGDLLQWKGEGTLRVYDADKLAFAARKARASVVDGKVHVDSHNPVTKARVAKQLRQAGHKGLWVPEAELLRLGLKPDDEFYAGHNLLMTAGVTRLWNLVSNQGGTQALDATHTRVGVSDNGGSLTLAAGNTDLGGTTNKYFNMVDAASTVSTNTNKWTSTFATGNGNFAWQDWGVDVGNTSGGATVAALLFNRVVVNLGTKTSAAAWAFSVTLSIA
jgi:hypothetical protein